MFKSLCYLSVQVNTSPSSGWTRSPLQDTHTRKNLLRSHTPPHHTHHSGAHTRSYLQKKERSDYSVWFTRSVGPAPSHCDNRVQVVISANSFHALHFFLIVFNENLYTTEDKTTLIRIFFCVKQGTEETSGHTWDVYKEREYLVWSNYCYYY